MHKIATDRPETLIEAVQLLFSYHCCLHLSGEPVSIGRIDQFLEPFLKETSLVEAQEIIDCLFVKLCEHVHVNTRLLNDMGAWGSIAVPYSSTGMFPNGDTINQWVQQVGTPHVYSPLFFYVIVQIVPLDRVYAMLAFNGQRYVYLGRANKLPMNSSLLIATLWKLTISTVARTNYVPYTVRIHMCIR